MAAVSKTAKALGSDLTLTSTSAADAATAMTELAKGGLNVDQAMKAAKGTLQLASAAGITAAEAASIQSSALNAFSLDASQAGRVADVLANAANAAAGEISDFGLGMSQASAVSAAMGISLEDTAATLGILANNGIRGSDAGTLLKSALLAVQSPSKQAQKAMDALNFSAYDASGNFVGLSSVFGQLQKAQKAMTPEAYAAATSTLFGSDAARLAGIAGKEGAAGFDAMREAMGKEGSAADVAAAKAKGVTGAFESFKSQLEGFQIDLFERVAPGIEKLVRLAAAALPKVGAFIFGIFDAVGALSDLLFKGDFTKRFAELFHVQEDSALVDFLLKIHDFIKDHLQPILAGLGAALAVLVTPLVLSLIGTLASFLGGALLSALSALLSPIALVALGIGGMVAIFVQAYKDSEPLRAAVEKLKDAFGIFFKAFDAANGAGGIQGFFDGLKAGITAAAPVVKSALAEMGTALWSWIKDNIGPALAQLGAWIAAVGDWIWNTGLPALGGFMADLGSKLWDWIGPQIGPALLELLKLLAAWDKWVYGTAIPWLYGAMADLGEKLVDWIGPRIGPMLTAIGEFLGKLVGWIGDTGLPWLWDALGDLASALVDWIGPKIVPMLLAIADFLGELVTWLWDVGLPWLWDALLDLADALWEWISPMIPPMLGKIGEFLGELVGWLLFTGLPLLVAILVKLGYELIAWLLPRIPELLANIAAFIGKLIWWVVTEGLPWLIRTMWDLGTGALNGLWDAFVKSPVTQAVLGWVESLGRGIAQKWEGVKGIFMGFVQWVTDTFWNNGLMKVWNWINDLWGGGDLKPINLVANVNTGAGTGGSGGINKRLATGGILPGYTPGRDVHQFFSPTGGRLDLSGGEAVMRPEFTRAMGSHGVNMLNAAARRNGVSGVAKALAAQTGYSQAHAGGGIIDLPGWLSTTLKFIPGGGFIGGVIDKINGGLGGAGTVAEGVTGMLKKAGTSIWDKIKELWDGSNSGGAGVQGKASPNGANGLGPKALAARAYALSHFTGISSVGGYANRNIAGTNTKSDHATGHAIDVMIANYKSATGIASGNAIAEYFRTNPGAFGTKYVIWRDRIANGGAGWAPYRHPGGGSSDTLQHRDHVHVSVFDKGGEANGVGYMPKRTLKPERVLSPEQTESFDRWLNGAGNATGNPLVGSLTIQVGGNADVRDGMEEAMFQLRRIKRGSGTR